MAPTRVGPRELRAGFEDIGTEARRSRVIAESSAGCERQDLGEESGSAPGLLEGGMCHARRVGSGTIASAWRALSDRLQRMVIVGTAETPRCQTLVCSTRSPCGDQCCIERARFHLPSLEFFAPRVIIS